jgi:hypothetical protein
MVTAVAFVAVTVRVEDPPGVIEAGLAATLTVGAADGDGSLGSVPDLAEPHPASVRKRDNSRVAARGAAIL